jgi:hypothetical protein
VCVCASTSFVVFVINRHWNTREFAFCVCAYASFALSIIGNFGIWKSLQIVWFIYLYVRKFYVSKSIFLDASSKCRSYLKHQLWLTTIIVIDINLTTWDERIATNTSTLQTITLNKDDNSNIWGKAPYSLPKFPSSIPFLWIS